MVNLTFLSLKDNTISTLPDFVGTFAHLETLDLSFNEFTSIPDFIGETFHLLPPFIPLKSTCIDKTIILSLFLSLLLFVYFFSLP